MFEATKCMSVLISSLTVPTATKIHVKCAFICKHCRTFAFVSLGARNLVFLLLRWIIFGFPPSVLCLGAGTYDALHLPRWAINVHLLRDKEEKSRFVATTVSHRPPILCIAHKAVLIRRSLCTQAKLAHCANVCMRACVHSRAPGLKMMSDADFRELEQYLDASSPVQSCPSTSGGPAPTMENLFGVQPSIYVQPDHVYRHARELVSFGFHACGVHTIQSTENWNNLQIPPMILSNTEN